MPSYYDLIAALQEGARAGISFDRSLGMVTGPAVAPTQRMSRERVAAELDEIVEVFQGGVRPIEFTDLTGWQRYGVTFATNGGTRVTGHYHPETPWKPPIFQLNPAPQSRHYYRDPETGENHLCFCRPSEWSPYYSLATATACVLRFLHDYALGRVD